MAARVGADDSVLTGTTVARMRRSSADEAGIYVTDKGLPMYRVGDKDTLIDQLGGRRVAELIPGAKFALIEGMGHDYPPQLWDQWVALVVDHIESV